MNNDDALSSRHCNDVDIVNLHSALCEVHRQNKLLTLHLHKQENVVTQLQVEMDEVKETIARLKHELWKEKAKTNVSSATNFCYMKLPLKRGMWK